ncbi:MAG: RsmB/NOP family class I SAM-dependent RNA methyltransferase [Synergistaceae bacterium]|jgi:16S rRNA (cytosine967-C5)-methyltransferase|nr:RsmB/NOP family class I SAM-dependent RNA methyltransferase [Synergistaceae bacterium]
MRGIEGALKVLGEVERGVFASESLRYTLKDIEPTERKLASTIVYVTLRRMGLWRHLLTKFCKKSPTLLSKDTLLSLTAGIAGVLELRNFKPGVLVNALVQRAKNAAGEASREPALINAVLHTVMEEAPAYIDRLRVSTALRDQALAFGVPGWVASNWAGEWGVKDAKRLIQMSTAQTWMALRVSPGVDAVSWMSECASLSPARSETLESCVRVEANPYPPDIPGYGEGRVTPQTESSMLAVEALLAYWHGEYLLDMCMGRGVKAGHILSYRPDAVIEGWDLSSARLKAAEREFARLGVSGRYSTVCGDATVLQPSKPPSAILLDAPCSGSGTWGRHPDGKWRSSPAEATKMEKLQRALLARACEILVPGGIIMYCTCSIFRGENENVAGSVMAARNDVVELPVRARIPASRRGKPYGTVILPETPWMDGFYVVLLKKKG